MQKLNSTRQTEQINRQHYLAVQLVKEAGSILLEHFGKIRNVRQKEHPSSVVCEADLASEAHIVRRIRTRFPDDTIVAEESGLIEGGSDTAWIIDPLDGTSNFVAGLPWFGVQIGVLRRRKPVAAAIFLPAERSLYSTRKGHGVRKNGQLLKVTPEHDLKKILCAFGFDATAGRKQAENNARLLMRVASGVRNTRATNSLVDFCYTVEGYLGGCINLNCKIWDIVPASLMLPEAGGRFTSLEGEPITYVLDENVLERTYRILGAGKNLHKQLLAFTRT